ncbi:NADP-dependent oxidoreductase [Nocardioides deserti]|uniref:NADP-dependent oxidoreductase n=1 Tax=Nocardioides deserti TaxID=1588644 RepID=A0ABR6U4G4_9ACTN|nr:NADP-dependent oxidoreductase [Nocardioides deserti]MBC2959325.1 NADP-dependent oxidoreductase [Nocardioides deserti]GGO68027.1 NADP-dependent oxidoreductase [Nocardioides deserti]
MPTTTREIHLASRPTGWPVPENFRTVITELADPGPGEVLVRNTVLSVDPYMRGRMNDTKSYVPPFALDAPLEGGAVGEVLASGDDRFSPGDTVLHQAGWREHALLPADQVRKVDVSQVPASAYLGVLGMPGLTAYVGLTRIAPVQEGDTVFVSGAAGAVGSVAGQVARELGASKVVGSAGSPEKVRWLTEDLGFDAAFDYHDGPVAAQLKEHGPVDVYFDNVGGEHLEAAIQRMADFGRIAACGAIASYNDTEPTPGPRNMFMVVQKRISLRGFIVTDHGDAAHDFYARAGAWVAEGKVKHRETFTEGLDSTVDAFLGLHRGDNIGKMLVRL